MKNEQAPYKAFVKAEDEAMIVCPVCDSAKAISVTQFRHRLHLIKVKCKCGHLFKVQLEFRRHLRKETDLEGTYELKPPAAGGGKILVKNLSLSGASFEVRGIHDLRIGQQGSLIFTLNNRQETVLFKTVIVKTITESRIGCEFVQDRAFERELGFYLLP
jgi:hypothetical protein